MKNTPSSTTSDLELFEAVKRGDPDWISLLYDEFYDYLVRFLYKNYESAIESNVRTAQDVEDVVRDLAFNSLSLLQDNICTGRYELSEEAKMSTYLTVICKHLASQFLKRKRIDVLGLKRELMELMPEEIDLPRYDLDQVKALDRALKILRDENPKCFKLLNLYVNNQKMSEIARSLNFSSEHSAKSQKYKCVKTLQSIYFKLNGEN